MAVPRTPASGDSPPAARTPDWATARPPHLQIAGPFTDQALWARVIRHARCADGTHDPEQWFPVSVQIEKARQEAAAAIAVCSSCPVRAQCLALSLRHWDIGQHGIWGGLVAAERAALRRLARVRMARHAPHVLLTPGADPGAAAHATPSGRSRGRQGEHAMTATAAAAVAGPHLIVGDTTGQVAGVGNLAPVRPATGTEAGLADASRTTPPS
jgi:WhiB family transcriptional regulator, redox-sensing transcriptional regulator